MAEYIERSALITELILGPAASLCAAIDAVREFPAANVAPVRHARWVKSKVFKEYLCCSDCHDAYIHYKWLRRGKYRYCPGCGAKMDVDLNLLIGEKVD